MSSRRCRGRFRGGLWPQGCRAAAGGQAPARGWSPELRPGPTAPSPRGAHLLACLGAEAKGGRLAGPPLLRQPYLLAPQSPRVLPEGSLPSRQAFARGRVLQAAGRAPEAHPGPSCSRSSSPGSPVPAAEPGPRCAHLGPLHLLRCQAALASFARGQLLLNITKYFSMLISFLLRTRVHFNFLRTPISHLCSHCIFKPQL